MPEPMLVEQRAVMHFRTRLERFPNGHCRLHVQTLTGALVGILDGNDERDVERQFRQAGYQRIPPQTADDLDLLRL